MIGSLQEMGTRAARVTVGVWVLAYDGVSWAVWNPAAAMDRVERRGLKMEKELNRRLAALERRSDAMVQRVRGGAADGVRRVRVDVQGSGQAAEEEIERQVEKALLRLGLPSRERLELLTREIENLSHKIDQELALLEQM